MGEPGERAPLAMFEGVQAVNKWEDPNYVEGLADEVRRQAPTWRPEPKFTPPWFLAPLVWLGYLVGLFALCVQCLAIFGSAVWDSIGAGADRVTGDREEP